MGAKNAGEGQTALPPIMVGKFEDAMRLIEVLIKEQTSVFGQNIAEYRDVRRESSTRTLSPEESVTVASSWSVAIEKATGEPEKDAAMIAAIQKSELTATDEVPMQEVLLAAGIATAPALLDAVKQIVALIEMPNDVHERVSEDGTLRDELNKRAKELRNVEISEARERASAALDHFQKAAGGESGEALSLIVTMVGQALSQAVESSPGLGSVFASLTGSLPDMAGTGG